MTFMIDMQEMVWTPKVCVEKKIRTKALTWSIFPNLVTFQ